MIPDMNISNWFTLSHPSKEEIAFEIAAIVGGVV